MNSRKGLPIREMKNPFFTITDEDGIAYLNTSDEIKYIPVKNDFATRMRRLARAFRNFGNRKTFASYPLDTDCCDFIPSILNAGIPKLHPENWEDVLGGEENE